MHRSPRTETLTTAHTFTVGTYRSTFEVLPAERDAGLHEQPRLVSLVDAQGAEVDEELLAAALTAVDEPFTPEALVDLLFTEAVAA